MHINCAVGIHQCVFIIAEHFAITSGLEITVWGHWERDRRTDGCIHTQTQWENCNRISLKWAKTQFSDIYREPAAATAAAAWWFDKIPFNGFSEHCYFKHANSSKPRQLTPVKHMHTVMHSAQSTYCEHAKRNHIRFTQKGYITNWAFLVVRSTLLLLPFLSLLLLYLCFLYALCNPNTFQFCFC